MKRARRGFTLVEMLVVMVLFGSVMAVSVQLIRHAYRLSQFVAEEHQTQRTAARLSHQVRTDCASATEVRAADDQAITFVDAQQQSWKYRVEGSQLIRSASASGVSPSREVFVFPPQSAIHLEYDETPTAVLRVTVQHPTPTGLSDRIDCWIEATIGTRAAEFSRPKESP